jgi:uncharacterized protein
MDCRLDDEVYMLPDGEAHLLFVPRRGCVLRTDANGVNLLVRLRERRATAEDLASRQFQTLVEAGVVNGEPLPPLPTPEGMPYAPTAVTLFLTNRCSLACRYCYAGGQSPDLLLDPRIAQTAIDRVMANATAAGRKRFTVGFHGGGEPTAAWPELVAAVEYATRTAEERGLRVTLGLTTNGCFTEEQARWIAKRFPHVSVSCDGPPDLQDTNRPWRGGGSSSEVLWRNVRILDELHCPYSFQCTVTREMAPRMPEIVRYLCEHGKPKTIKLEPVSVVGRFQGHSSDVPEYAAFATWFDEAFAVAHAAGVIVDFPSFRLAGPPQSTFCGTCQSPFSITPDGLVSACYEACWAGAAHADRLIIGRYNADTNGFVIHEARLAQLRRRNVNNLEGCRDCFCKYACAGDCPVRNWRASEGAGVLDTGARCDLIRAIGKSFLRRLLDGTALALVPPPELAPDQCGLPPPKET